MRALSVRQPWAWAIAAQGKDVENRTWRTSYRELAAIHASSGADSAWQLPSLSLVRSYEAGGPSVARGAIVAVALILGCDQCHGECSPWAAVGQWHWHLGQVRALPEPVPAAGRLGLWAVPPEAAAAVARQLGTVEVGQ
jgi:hypothetical protein